MLNMNPWRPVNRSRLLSLVAALLVVCIAVGGARSAWAAAPANDTIGGATIISSLPFGESIDGIPYTTDAQDDQLVGNACGFTSFPNSAWYVYTASSASEAVPILSIFVNDSATPSGWVAATGTPGSLTPVGCGLPERFTLFVTAPDTTYYVLVLGQQTGGLTVNGVVDKKPTAALSIPAVTPTLAVALALSGTDEVGISGYLLKTSPSTPGASDPGWQATQPTSFTLPAGPDGLKTLYGWTKDPAGNVSLTASDTTLLDTTKPTASLSLPEFTSTRTVAVTLAGTDANGIGGSFLSPSPTTPTAADPGWVATSPATFTLPAGPDGNRKLYGWTKDPAGNVSATASDTTLVDMRAPVVRITNPRNHAKLGAFDEASGSAGEPAPHSGLAFGRFSIVRKSGGTCEWWDPKKRELVPGSCSTPLRSAIPRPHERWHARTGRMDVSGVFTLTVEFTDKAGNTGSASRTFSLDVVDPTVSLAIPPLTRTLKVPVTLAAGDNVGVTGYMLATASPPPTYKFTKTKPKNFTFPAGADGTLTLYAWAIDAAGNVSEAVAATTVLDRQTPEVAIDFPTFDAELTELKKIAGSATDPGAAPNPGSGLASGRFAILRKTGTACKWWNPKQGKLVAGPCAKPLSFALPITKTWSKAIGTLDDAGAYTLTVEFTDRAGNTGKATRRFTIVASGGSGERGAPA